MNESGIPGFAAVRISSIEDGPFMPPYGKTKYARFKVESTIDRASFSTVTGPHAGDLLKSVVFLERHGFTVLSLSPDWDQYTLDTYREQILNDALQKIRRMYSVPGTSSSEQQYNQSLGDDVLKILNRRFPRHTTNLALKAALTPEPSDSLILLALDALFIEGMIEGMGIPRAYASRPLEPMQEIGLTGLGRRSVRNGNEFGHTANVVQGDQIINYGQAGSMGRSSNGRLAVSNPESGQVDLTILAQELERIRMILEQMPATRENTQQLGALADAEEQSELGNADGVLIALKRVKAHVAEIAKAENMTTAASFISQAMGF